MTVFRRFLAPHIRKIVEFFCLFCSVSAYADQQGFQTATGSHDSLASYTSTFTSELALFFRFIIGLAIVIILLILTLWFLRSIMRAKIAGGGYGAIDVVSIRYIDQKKAIALIRVLNRVLIIGIAENTLSVLGELTPEEIGSLNLDRKSAPGAFRTVFTRFFEKKSGNG
jgi:flagellar biogenesis protein FliO